MRQSRDRDLGSKLSCFAVSSISTAISRLGLSPKKKMMQQDAEKEQFRENEKETQDAQSGDTAPEVVHKGNDEGGVSKLHDVPERHELNEEAIRKAYESGEKNLQELANEYGVSKKEMYAFVQAKHIQPRLSSYRR